MLKLIIIDDEEQIRTQLSKAVNYSDLGIKVVGLFSCGKKALEFLKNNHVDIVVSDIKMPDISGLDIAERIYNTQKNTSVIIISGHNNFEYAQKALKYNIFDYLLKPVTNDDYYNCLSRLVVRTKNSSFIPDSILSQGKTLIHHIKNGLISDYKKIQKGFLDLGINIKCTYPCAIVECRIPDVQNYLDNVWNYEAEGLLKSLNCFFEKSNQTAYCFSNAESLKKIEITAISKSETMSFYDNIVEYFEITKEEISNILNLKIDITVKRICPLIKLADITIDENLTKNHAIYIYEQLSSGNINNAFENLNTIYSIYTSVSLIKNFSQELKKLLCFPSLSTLTLKIDNVFDKIENSEDYKIIKHHLESVVLLIASEMKLEQIEIAKLPIEKAIEYIEQNNNISLSEVAEHVGFSPTYFSKYFKERTGKKFVEYLTFSKIERAKNMLINSNMKVYEIAEDVGYNKLSTFNKIFKLYTGSTPTQFRKDKQNNV